MSTLRPVAVLCTMLLSAVPAFASCWNAADSGGPGDPVEICLAGVCEQTFKTHECAMLDGLSIGYANGMMVEQDLSVSPPVTVVSRNGQRLTPEQVAGITCVDTAGAAACAFGMAQASAPAAGGDPAGDEAAQLAQARTTFGAMLGIDAETMQIRLIEAGLMTGPADGQWGPATEAAVRAALAVARENGIVVDTATDTGLFEMLNAISARLFDPDSGLSKQPFAGAHMLVVASRQDMGEAQALFGALSQRLADAGLPDRAGVLTSMNGWLAITAGMYSKGGCTAMADRLKAAGVVPGDAYCAPVEKFDPMNWTT